jgi:hypothetical protein
MVSRSENASRSPAFLRKIESVEVAMHKSIGIAAIALVTTLAAPSYGQFGERAKVSFAADRLMGIYIFRGEGHDTTFGLGGPPAFHPYMLPRLGIDVFVIDHLSIGGSFWWYAHDDNSNFLLSPRVGYAIDFSHSFGFWPRGGLTFRNNDAGPNNNNDEVALTLEALFYGSPADHFAFTFGPVFDIGLAGDGDEARNFGIITFGILGWI